MENQKDNQNNEISGIIHIIPKYTQTLCSETFVYFSNFQETTIATESRKALLIENINLIKDKLVTLEEIINITTRE